MIFWLAAAALAAALAVIALAANAGAYTRKAEARFPARGRFVEAEGARIHVREVGPEHGPRLLLIHGASSNLIELWGPLAEEFSPIHRVVAYDRPGMGHSTRPRRSAHTMASQALVAAEVLKQTGGPALVVAHSLGSAVALRLALDHPHLVIGLVLVAPASHPYPGKPAWWARLASTPLIGDLFTLLIPWLGPMRSAAAVANNFWPQPVPVNYLDEAAVPLIFRPAAFKASALDVCASNVEFGAQQPRYGDLLTPTVIITAEKDRIVSPKRHARALAADLPAAELVIAPDAGHMPHRLRTDLVIAAIRRVNELTAAPAEG
ncbi:MAG TPA: alpha/beta hydrolase [Vitreimonas sp.]|uniref:alpha/beta fold hydrolase n=1 Tax=Vitreimonas sp. TaxID=3069702 RepID=UPI002D379FBF|nr:alpha/beta hydrolase [Vitreimonas sp.]HYD86696.1 alpha/beta hydrolase [Vitreimonas sp.]